MRQSVIVGYCLCFVAALAMPFAVGGNSIAGYFIALLIMPLFIVTIPLDVALEGWIQKRRAQWGAVFLSLGLAGTVFSWVGYEAAQDLHLFHVASFILTPVWILSIPSFLALGSFLSIFGVLVLPSFNLAVPLIPVGAYMLWDHRRPKAKPAVARTPAT